MSKKNKNNKYAENVEIHRVLRKVVATGRMALRRTTEPESRVRTMVILVEAEAEMRKLDDYFLARMDVQV